ncbi:MAG: hypothetical protein JXB85_03120 [Anaerolineales bacterium]|nr:hypothetical protein [Anaerolineales bacterium]
MHLREQVYTFLSPRDTQALLEIWVENNRQDQTALAFGIIADILHERGKNPPRLCSATA